ncbi:MAG: hypothetical protein H6Q20_1941 [Bacteroidetes bacterium]|nr:hypothetical protein [Bacteroidota bacterium]
MKSKIFIATLFFILGFIVHSFLITRKQNREKENFNLYTTKSMNEPVHSIGELNDSILKAGRRDYYEELQISYLDRNSYEFLPWALLMANKYNDTGAYLDVYICLFEFSNLYDSTGLESWSLDNLDKKTQKMAIEYLIKAAEKGHNQAKEILGRYYLEGRYIEKNIALGNKLIKESKKPTCRFR